MALFFWGGGGGGEGERQVGVEDIVKIKFSRSEGYKENVWGKTRLATIRLTSHAIRIFKERLK